MHLLSRLFLFCYDTIWNITTNALGLFYFPDHKRTLHNRPLAGGTRMWHRAYKLQYKLGLVQIIKNTLVRSSSCHLDRAWNDEFSEPIFVLIFASHLKVVQVTKCYFFWVIAPLYYLEYVPNCKTRLQLKKTTITDIWHSTLYPNDMNQTWN